MKARRGVWTGLLLSALVIILTGSNPLAAGDRKKGVWCSECHPDLNAVLPQQHPKISGKKIGSCYACHDPQASDKGQARPISARMHLKHIPPGVGLDCNACHLWKPQRSFGFPGKSFTLGKPSVADMELNRKVFISWATSSYVDALHAQRKIACSGCHGKSLPQKGDQVENDRCLSCHGSFAALADKTRPVQFPDRNPHQSHMGEIGCTVCHKAHQPSTVFCLNCHRNFNLKIKGAVNP